MSFQIHRFRWVLSALILCTILFHDAQAQTHSIHAGASHAASSSITLSTSIGQAIIGSGITPYHNAHFGFWKPQSTNAASVPLAGERIVQLNCAPQPHSATRYHQTEHSNKLHGLSLPQRPAR